MLSVLKHTKSPVKFWFLKNFLSPTVKVRHQFANDLVDTGCPKQKFVICFTSLQDFLPHMAKEYGFKYELVQYKWPRWLHHQTEKQRIIWG